MYDLLTVTENNKTPIEIALGVDDEGMTTARKLYEFLELAQGQFSRWAKTNITENEFAVEYEDYWGFDINVEGNIVKDYRLTAHFAKKLSMKGHGERAEEAREYFTRLEEKVKQELTKPRSQAELLLMYAQQFYDQEQQIKAIQSDVNEIKAKLTTHDENYYTIAGYASLRGINVDVNKAAMLGRKAGKISREHGYETGKVWDQRFGTVNTYHLDVLKDVFQYLR